ncbi:GNAT family N-acetyltransferase [Luedemannella helvata]|uniref:GNAT family N-acetyltransferase n=1 Tax=Luedemannella helvata TaxID=349315 RepID=A0ABN2L6K1_9ACTN
MILHVARFAELTPTALYNILRLRVDVFVVEQECVYPDLDGLDLLDTTRHLWFAPPDEPDQPLAYLRLMSGPDGDRIGRVCTAATARGGGLAGRLMTAALGLATPPVRLNAQAYLTEFYRRHGFAADGPEFLDDGIPHVPMLRKA